MLFPHRYYCSGNKSSKNDLTSTVCSGSCGGYLEEKCIMYMAVLQDIYAYFNKNSIKSASLIYNPILLSS